MKRSSPHTFIFVLAAFTASLLAAPLLADPNADNKTAPQLMPGSSLIYAQIADPKALIDLIMDHPLRKKIESFPQYQDYLASPQYEQLQNGLTMFEKQTGMKWREALESISGGGIHLAYDLSTNGIALLIKATDGDKLAKLQQSIIDFADKHNRGAIQKGRTYRDIETWKVGKGGFAIVGKWFVFTNSAEMGKTIFDNMVDEPINTLSTDRDFKAASAAQATGSDKPTAFLFARLSLARGLGLLAAFTKEKSDNAGAELLLGGLMETIKHAPFVTTALHIKNDQVKLTVGAPHDASQVKPARGFFFAPPGSGSAPQPLKPKGTLFSFSAYRDVAAMLRSADDLFDENVAAGIAQADSQFTLFFSGRPFTTEILGSLKPHTQIIVTQPAFKDVTPAIKIPAFAIVMQLKKPDETTQAQFRTAFLTILNFVNLQGTMDGKPMLLTDIDKSEGVTLLTSKYVFDESKGDKNKADMIYNFSPAMAIVGERIIIASTRDLAEELIVESKKQKPDATIAQNTLIELDGPAVLAALKDNRQTLISQNMLEKGHSPAQAANEIDTLLELVGYVKSLKSSMTFQNKWATVELDVKLNFSTK